MVSQNQVFRQIACYLAELFRQIVCYLAELFRQIAFPKKGTYSFILQKVFCVLGFFYRGLMWFHRRRLSELYFSAKEYTRQ